MRNLNFVRNNIAHQFLSFLSLGLILVAIPITVSQSNTPSNFQTSASDFSITPYPGLTWTAPKDYSVSVIMEEGTANERVMLSKGMAVTTTTKENISESVYIFYNEILRSKGFELKKITGSPKFDSSWVANYISEGNYCEVQYYRTPHDETSHTILLFFGTLQ